jgi:hypothetical protein
VIPKGKLLRAVHYQKPASQAGWTPPLATREADTKELAVHTIIVTLAVIAIVACVIGRQLLGEPLRGKRVIALPTILALVGAVDLGRDGRHPHATDIVLIAISGVIAIVIGLGQGRMMRLESRGGALWGKMPVKACGCGVRWWSRASR